jgi:cytochrome c oxidase cbb3-type subunit 4
MDINFIRSLVTVAAFLCFVGILLWAYSGRSRERFREAALIPFTEDSAPGAAARRGPGSA